MLKLESFESLKPNDVFDVVTRELFVEVGTEHDEYLRSLNCYEWYYAISKYYQPKSYFEIGVRLGYSMGTVITASDVIDHVLGWDNESYIKNSIERAKSTIEKYITCNRNNVNISIFNIDSQKESKLVIGNYDMIHIDGDHRSNSVYHDCVLVKDSCKVLVIDDYNNNTSEKTKNGIDRFMNEFSGVIKDNLYIPSIRGMMIIEF